MLQGAPMGAQVPPHLRRVQDQVHVPAVRCGAQVPPGMAGGARCRRVPLPHHRRAPRVRAPINSQGLRILRVIPARVRAAVPGARTDVRTGVTALRRAAGSTSSRERRILLAITPYVPMGVIGPMAVRTDATRRPRVPASTSRQEARIRCAITPSVPMAAITDQTGVRQAVMLLRGQGPAPADINGAQVQIHVSRAARRAEAPPARVRQASTGAGAPIHASRPVIHTARLQGAAALDALQASTGATEPA